jgi:hypothetical protein
MCMVCEGQLHNTEIDSLFDEWHFFSVSSSAVSKLCIEGDPPTNLILESPFTSIGEEVKHHMLAAVS